MGINISGSIPATTTAGRQRRRSSPQKPLKNSHNKKHRDQNGSSNKPKRNSIHRLIKMPPVIISLILCVQ
ncbi:hypothetical protein Hanom_Chr16g01487011 [Helianthus anomalus]